MDGAPWKFGREITGYRSYWPDSGHGRLTVRPNLATVEFVSQQPRLPPVSGGAWLRRRVWPTMVPMPVSGVLEGDGALWRL